VKLTVLGKYSPFPPAGGAGPGYWVQFDEGVQRGQGGEGAQGPQGVLLDCGPGVLSRFQETVGPLSLIRRVILSHLHFDHTSDFHSLRYAASPARQYRDLPQHITVYAPALPEKEASLLAYRECVDAKVVEPGTSIELGQGGEAVSITFFSGEHPIPCHAMRIEDPRGVIAYSGDSRPCDSLVEAARGADLFLCEASAIEEDAAFAAAGHLTAKQAGEVAKRAGVKRLLLTHLWPLYDENVLLEECRRVFPAAEIAKERATYTL
jgi:ribonuclease BN (tRNA processing enzyme)